MGLLNFLRPQNNSSPDQRFLGRWKLLKDEGSMEIGHGVTMTLTEDGKLVYVIHQKDSKQVMNLVFRVEGNHLVTNQPSHPQGEKTKFSFDSEGNLILDYDGNKSWFTRV
jgi:hypothetical protein